jgi:hypothetical protein
LRQRFSCEALTLRIGSAKNTEIEVGLDHKEGTVSPHRERDVSKDPFRPPRIVKLDLWHIPLWGAAKVHHLDRGIRRNLRDELCA